MQILHSFLLLVTWIPLTDSCFHIRKINECGCFDYKTLTLPKIFGMDPVLGVEISKGKFTLPVYEYANNCTYIHVKCDVENTNATRRLIRTNWPEMDMVYSVTFTDRLPRTSTLWFNVKCDPKSHEWKYTEVDDDREIVNEQIVCHSK